jgi:DNA-binding response OmpR family regulator
MNRVLIVEDNISLCTLYSRVLENANVEVSVAHSCQMALDYLAQAAPDIVLLDMTLPDGSGQQVIDYIKSHLSDASIRIIVISGNEYRRNSELLAAVDQVLLKPVSTLALLDTIQQMQKAA